MFYNEFKEKVESFKYYEVANAGTFSEIYFKGIDGTEDYLVGSISHIQECVMDIIAEGETDIQITKLMIEFARTAIKDRHPNKEYYARLNLPNVLDEEKSYLNKCTSASGRVEQILGSKYEYFIRGESIQTKFTMEEIKEMIPYKELDKFQLIPVEEEK